MGQEKTSSTRRSRSPRYPVFDLQEAVEKARQFYEKEQLNTVPVEVAIGHWDYSPDSGPGKRSLAAMLHFGLLEQEGTGKERSVRLSELGTTVVLDEREDSAERRRAIREAALRPKVYAELWQKWGPSLPSDDAMRLYLLRELGFNHKVVDGFIEDFRATVRFARLAQREEVSRGDHQVVNTDERNGSNEASEENIPTAIAPRDNGVKSRIRDLTIPLLDGGMAVLRTPVPLSNESFNLMMNVLETMKPAITRSAKRPDVVGNEAAHRAADEGQE